MFQQAARVGALKFLEETVTLHETPDRYLLPLGQEAANWVDPWCSAVAQVQAYLVACMLYLPMGVLQLEQAVVQSQQGVLRALVPFVLRVVVRSMVRVRAFLFALGVAL
jgi:type IV secretory pathway TrbF-like protein